MEKATSETGRQTITGIIVRVFLLIPMFQAIGAIRQLNETESGKL